jgi:hypothetical protein
MTFEEYKSYFSDIIDKDQDKQVAPYDNPMYYDYTKLNWSRMKRWLKTGKLSSEVLEAVKKIKTPQNWIIITEPWCGDASHNVPFMEMIAKENPLISISYELRDREPNRINEYLTNGGKSIPKLIIRDTEGVDLATWGPRPEEAQVIYNNLMQNNASFDDVKIEMQNWYNENKGNDLQKEFAELFLKLSN